MAKIDVNVFTNEIEKTYTILKQNLIIIDTIKQLIDQGNLSEDTIATLQTAINRVNATVAGLEGAIDKTNNTIEEMNKVMPTDINVDSNNKLILEHDGVEITGQKKLLSYRFTYNSNTNMTNINSNFNILGFLQINNGFIKGKGGASIDLSEPYNIYLNSVDDQETYISFSMHNGDGEINGLTDKNVKTLFGNQSIYGSGNIDLYKHYLTISCKLATGTSTAICNILVQSSSNTDCSSTTGATQKLKDLLKISGTNQLWFEQGLTNDYIGCQLYWNGQVLGIIIDNEAFNITKIEDRVETI